MERLFYCKVGVPLWNGQKAKDMTYCQLDKTDAEEGFKLPILVCEQESSLSIFAQNVRIKTIQPGGA